MRAVPVDRAGVGSAVLNSSRQVGGSLGVAVMGAIVARSLASPPTAATFVEGFSNALVVASIIAFVGAAVAFLMVRHQPHDDRHVAPEPAA
jgi:sugar phosphate permease